MSFGFTRLVVAILALAGVLFAHCLSASAQTLPAAPAGARVLQSGNSSVTHGSGSNLFVPNNGTFYLDYAVEPGKELMLTMLTGAQYQAVSAGRKVDGQPVMKYMLSGAGTQSVKVGRGNYFVAFTGGGAGTRIQWRGSFKN